jgi:hypothetical protein
MPMPGVHYTAVWPRPGSPRLAELLLQALTPSLMFLRTNQGGPIIWFVVFIPNSGSLVMTADQKGVAQLDIRGLRCWIFPASHPKSQSILDRLKVDIIAVGKPISFIYIYSHCNQFCSERTCSELGISAHPSRKSISTAITVLESFDTQ